MNLNEALATLKIAGYNLIKENADNYFLCYSIYGDRAHSTPENADIYRISKNKKEIIDAIVDWFEAGPDDIWFCGVIIVDETTANNFKNINNENFADSDDCKILLDLIKNTPLEYSGDSGLDLFDEDDYEGSIKRIRKMVTNDVNNLSL